MYLICQLIGQFVKRVLQSQQLFNLLRLQTKTRKGYVADYRTTNKAYFERDNGKAVHRSKPKHTCANYLAPPEFLFHLLNTLIG